MFDASHFISYFIATKMANLWQLEVIIQLDVIICKKHPNTSAMKMKTRSILLVLGLAMIQDQISSKHYLVESKGKQYLVETEGRSQVGKGDVTFLGGDETQALPASD